MFWSVGVVFFFFASVFKNLIFVGDKSCRSGLVRYPAAFQQLGPVVFFKGFGGDIFFIY